MEVIKKGAYFTIIFLFVTFGNSATVLATAYIVCAFVALIVNSIPNKILIGYNFMKQFADLLPNLAISILMVLIVLGVNLLDLSPVFGLILQILFGVVTYVLCSVLFKNQAWSYLLCTIKDIKTK